MTPPPTQPVVVVEDHGAEPVAFGKALRPDDDEVEWHELMRYTGADVRAEVVLRWPGEGET
eukprot:CAMPEP_0196653124 /NCGR_PEP_ID=MMETSP1086-20130531/2714_1 /TAXON_ID=77921 /ORGANISM="Cyanoptyche  gloeocystis , Strain SAG4.97" /LENGTH=60 /DNA_ID=CAMNT_0041984147 /DNA_START=904 /DNA_END=1082 /DNA_ORIENTATION=+